MIHREQIAADLLDPPRDSVSMQATKCIEGSQHHQRQRALQDISFLLWRHLG
jgi:hypothetical protein